MLLYSPNFVNSAFNISGCLWNQENCNGNYYFVWIFFSTETGPENTYLSAKFICSHGSVSMLNRQGLSNGRHNGSIVLFAIQLTLASARNRFISFCDGSRFNRVNAFPAMHDATMLVLYAAGVRIPAGPYLIDSAGEKIDSIENTAPDDSANLNFFLR